MAVLSAVTNGQVSDATHVNQFRDLFRGGFVHDVKNGYGAVGDGVTDDTAVFETAKDTAGAWAEVYVPPGTYIIGAFQFDVVGQHWTFARGAIFKKKTGDVIGTAVEATDVILEGGEWDGNRAGMAGASGVVIQPTAHRFLVRDMRIHNTNNAAVFNLGADFVRVLDNEVYDTGLAGIFSNDSADGMEISGNYVHDFSTGVGIQIHGTDPNYSRRPLISNNYVTLGSANYISIEVWGLVPGAVITGNRIVSGSMGISVDQSDHSVISGNHVYLTDYAGIELAGSKFCSVSGNTIQGTGVTNQNGIIVSSPSVPSTFHTITGNTIYNVYNGIAAVAVSNHITITANVIHTITRLAMDISASDHAIVTGNQIYNPSGVAYDGIKFTSCVGGIVTGNDFTNLSNGVYASGSSDLRAIGNRFTNVTTKVTGFSANNNKAAFNDPTTGDTVTL